MADLFSPALLLLVMALLAAPAAILAGQIRPNLAAPAGGAFAVAAFACAVWGYTQATPDIVNFAWAPTWDLRFHLELDGLAALYAMLATGIGAVVVLYASAYMPAHLHHQHRDDGEIVPFLAYLLLFMGAMVGLVLAQDLILIFVFWDITAIASFFLIGYDRNAESRSASFMAILVTGISAIALLLAAIMLYAAYGTWSLSRIIVLAQPGQTMVIVSVLIIVGGLAKSAQVPLHFWLPRAMAAPTPVSSYLHSAAMVAAGVFLVGRFYPLIQLEPVVRDAMIVVGFVSMAVGGIIALTREHLKQILAYSTISQYGYVVVMFGFGGDYGAAGASFYVIAHALAKCALFLTAGAVIEATGEARIQELGGLRKRLPVLAYSSAIAAAGLAALPLTAGFFKDELFFAAALERGTAFSVMAMFGAALTFAYIGRFWLGIFAGKPGEPVHHALPWQLVTPVVGLGILTILFGIVPGPITGIANAAASVSRNTVVDVGTAYHLDTRPENLLALGTFALGGVLIASERFWRPVAQRVAYRGDLFGPARGYDLLLQSLNQISGKLRSYEVRDLRGRVATILAPAAILVVLGVATAPGGFIFRVGPLTGDNVRLLLIMTVAIAAAITVTLAEDHFTMALLLSGVGFSLAGVYTFINAPDVALVAVLIETVSTLLFLGILALLPRWVLREANQEPAAHNHKRRDAGLAIVGGGLAFVAAWGVLSRPAAIETVALRQAELAPEAHASDVVTVILADFRGLDTMGEITVIGIAFLGIAALLLRGRLR